MSLITFVPSSQYELLDRYFFLHDILSLSWSSSGTIIDSTHLTAGHSPLFSSIFLALESSPENYISP